ncbi:MAG: putative beta-lysine N-acetyltransferase [Caldisericia bacterium]|nr:putative beta-lysine N-acetyltransferase [Caldisericia bacterium]
MDGGTNNLILKFDQIQKFDNGTVIQHGKYNDRIYLMKKGNIPSLNLILELLQISEQKHYSKIFAKSCTSDLPIFIDQGFTVEAIVPGYFNGKDDLFMVCYYLNFERSLENNSEKYNSVLNLAKSKSSSAHSCNDKSDKFNIRACQHEDIDQMISIYKEVFPSYPFPIHDPQYIHQTMDDDVDYYCVEVDGNILALSSAEINYESKNAEMTDFATPLKNCGNNFSSKLLSVMETNTAKKGIKTFYTIARSISPGMNITFARNRYMYGGRLKNNTNISGGIESMNIWHKSI